MSSPLRTEAQAAAALGISPATLRNNRLNGTPILPHVPVGRKPMIRYRQVDIDRYVDRQLVA